MPQRMDPHGAGVRTSAHPSSARCNSAGKPAHPLHGRARTDGLRLPIDRLLPGRLRTTGVVMLIGEWLLCAGGCPTVPPCEDLPEPYFMLTATYLPVPGGDLPVSIVGRACGGGAIDPLTLSSAYDVIIYAHTDKWYVQPFEISFHHSVNQYGYLMTRSHYGDRIHAFVAVRGLSWSAELGALPAVDGEFIVAEADATVGG